MSGMTPVALGFRAHSGWAAAVAVIGPPEAPDVVHRARIEMLDRTVPAQPYHEAAEIDLAGAENVITRCVQRSRELATRSLEALLEELRKRDYDPVAGAVLLASGRPLGTLESILASHAMIHTAEGELYRNALIHANERCGLSITRVRERDLLFELQTKLGVSEDQVKRRLAALGRRLGPPWRQDEKTATLAAALALRAIATTRIGREARK